MGSGNFVSAALPSVITHIDNAMKDNPEYMNNHNVNRFLLNNVDKHLTSIGIALERGAKVSEKIVDKYGKNLNRMVSRPYMKDCEIIIDSAGFQIQQNYLSGDQVKPFINLYHDEFLSKCSDLFQYAFNLDISPGLNHCPFKSFDEIKQLNEYS